MSANRAGLVSFVGCTLILPMLVHSQGVTPLLVWKNRDGEITVEQSRKDATKMTKYVAENGALEVTITFNVKYDPSLGPESVEQQHQQAAVDQLYDLVVGPMIASGLAWHPYHDPIRAGPVAVIGVNLRGLRTLLRTEHVQIIASNIPNQ